ncbi:cation-translocating P-type ATPase [Candidatus Phytoplasma phoenicium]|uniref:Cation-transporting P-type ATPase A n=1 Tax=Candidatus Phytoplasma phoenicium TaxID=198422 RepID=A0A0L0MKC3_9MOLU|nr:cation-transporting P-type ATPase [Candidatus Phytoplasma phoenicium]KND62740.1 Cation-transporting P-type ATPase A [Candidatus Phytoplasma phoenicium]
MNASLQQLELNSLETVLKTNFQKGLESSVAAQRLTKNGLNKLIIETKVFWLKKLINQLKDLFVCLLLIAAIITLIIGYWNNQPEELYEGCLILVIIIINAFLGLFFERQKDISLKIIKNKTKPYTRVLRNGKVKLILKENIVIGDIIFLETGDVVPADIRLIKSTHLKVNEVILTGETTPVYKNMEIIAPIFNLLNAPHMVFMQTIIVYGHAKGVVLKTGMQTQIGQIKQLIFKSLRKKTPLEKNLNQFTQFICCLVVIFINFNFIINLFKNYLVYHIINWLMIQKLFLSSIALAVAVIPEGLLTIVTIILAFGIRKLVHQKVIVKNLKALETIGAINVICADKTGTLTKNQLTIKKLYLYPQMNIVHSDLRLNPYINKLLTFSVLCNNAHLNDDDSLAKKNNTVFVADPVDQAFINLARLWNFDFVNLTKIYRKTKEFPFDDHYKLMITIHEHQDTFLVVIKGAGELILRLSSLISYNDQIISKNSASFQQAEQDLNHISQEGYKILGIAYATILPHEWQKDHLTVAKILEQIKSKIIFLGAFGMEDPIRSGIKKNIKYLQQASIIPIMITGDHLFTAKHVATHINLLTKETDLAITGDILDCLDEKEFLDKLPNIKVYARVNPEHKLKIIQAWQKKGKIVAMIGDGVNDAPSIKQADIGIAMGITGTEISQQAATMILTDDNFNAIPKAIEEGRNIFHNIKKSVIFLLSCNIGEIILVFLHTFLGNLVFSMDFQLLTTLQILWVNLITDSLVAIALGMEPKESNLMKEKPRKINQSFINKMFISKIILEGGMIGLLTWFAAFIGYQKYHNNYQYAQTFAFMVLCCSQLIHVFNLRHFTKSIFQLAPNFYLIIFFMFSLFLQITIYILPFCRTKFKLVLLNWEDLMIISFWSLMPLFIIEIWKKIKNFQRKAKI